MKLVKSNFVGTTLLSLGKRATANPGTTNLVSVLMAAATTYFGVDVHQVANILHTVATFIDKTP